MPVSNLIPSALARTTEVNSGADVKTASNVSNPETVKGAIRLASILRGLGLEPIALHSIDQQGKCSCGSPHVDAEGRPTGGPGKHPIDCLWNEIEITPERIAEWCRTAPHANIGIRTGAKLPDGRRLVALDVDPRNGGVEAWAALEAEHGPFPATPTVQTGGHPKGRHYYLGVWVPDGARLRKQLAPGIDVRFADAQVVGPGSNHVSGAKYRQVIGRELWRVTGGEIQLAPIADLPAWALAILLQPVTAAQPQGERTVFGPATPEVLEAARERLRQLGPSVTGQHGDDRMIAAALVLLNDFALSPEEAELLLREHNATCQPRWGEADLQRFLRSAGRDVPRQSPYGCRRVLAERPVVTISTDEHVENAACAKILASHPDIYSVDRRLALVDAAGSVIFQNAAQIRHLMSERAVFKRLDAEGALVTTVARQNTINYLSSEGTVPARQLDEVTLCPSMMTDGSITQPGYNAATRSYQVQTCEYVPPPDRPTRDDALRALEVIRWALQFPFEKLADESAFLAIAGSQFVRNTVDLIPIAIIDANTPGAGKTLGARHIHALAVGRDAECATWPGEVAEQRKVTTAFLRARVPVKVFDNVIGEFGGAAVNVLATSTFWSDRILGESNEVRIPNRTQLIVTGNNIVLAPDTARRVLMVKLISPEARPQDRGGFKVQDLVGWTIQKRPRLIRAWLTIFRAYHVAGRPDAGLKPRGGFEQWCALVRNALLWLGMPDPMERTEELERTSDVRTQQLESLIRELEPILGSQGLFPGELVAALRNGWDSHRALRDLLIELSPPARGQDLPSPQAVAYLLKAFLQRRTANRKFLAVEFDAHSKNNRWLVRCDS